MIYSYIYLSSATEEVTPRELERILQKARSRNEADGITGILLYHDGNFMQFLEGPEEAVLRCVNERIKPARQHRGLITLQSKPIRERDFGDWRMAYVPVEKMGEQRQRAFMDLLDLRADGQFQQALKSQQNRVFLDSFLSSFRDIREAADHAQS